MSGRPKRKPPPVISDLPHEEWRPVFGYEGRYSVSNMGRVRGECRVVPGKLGSHRTLPAKLMSQSADSSGYLQVSLTDELGRCTFKVAHLVARAFIGPKPIGMQICHSDGKRQNNAVSNLRHDTPAGNAADKLKHATHTRGERSGMAKLTQEQVNDAKRDCRSCRAIARTLGVHHSTISSIKRGVSWQ